MANSNADLLAWESDNQGNYPVRAAMVSTLNGYVAGADGSSNSITNKADRELFLALRNMADIILVGAETVRTEQYKTPKNPSIAILSRSGDFSSTVYHDLQAGSHDESKIKVVNGNVKDIIEGLREQGYEKILCEGGLSVLEQLTHEYCLDELMLTIVPEIICGSEKYHLDFPAQFTIVDSLTSPNANILKLVPKK